MHVNKVDHVTTIDHVAARLGESVDWPYDVANEMDVSAFLVTYAARLDAG